MDGSSVDHRLLFAALPTPVLVMDPDLVIVDANEAYLAATMTSRESIVGRPVFDVFPDKGEDEPRARLRESLRRVVRERVVDTAPIQKYAVARPESAGGGMETRYWAPVNAPVLGPGGELLWVINRVEDVTAYMQARELAGELQARTERMASEVFARQELQEQNQSMHALLDSLDTAVVGCDAAGLPVLHNEAARSLFGDLADGTPVQEWAQHRYTFHPDGRSVPGNDVPLMRALRGERVRDAEVVFRRPGQPRQFFRVNGRPVVGQTGLAAVVALHEVTGHRRATKYKECELEIAQRTSKPDPVDVVLADIVQVIGGMLEWSAVEFWTVDDVTQVLRRATCWAEPGHDRLGRTPYPLRCGQDLPGHAWQTANPVWAQDLPIDDLGASRSALAIPITSGSAVLGVLVCYSDTSEVPDDTRTAIMTGIGAHIGEFLARRRAERLTTELDRTRDEFIALVGHELRTPLTSVQAYTDTLLEEAHLPDEHRVMLQVMQRNTAALHAIVMKLLDVAGLRAGHIDLHPQFIDLTVVVRAAVDNARTSAATRVTIETNLPPVAPLHGDPARLRQVVDELLSNALTWARDDSTIVLNLHTDPLTVTLAVSNAGERIPADERDRLFDLFFRSDAVRHSGIPGSGLGLTIVRAIVEQHGGTIRVGETDEAATTFTVRLPTQMDPPPTPPMRARLPERPG
ncbi:ATP-binding protein [Actinoplanes sp. NPDC026619]|uniref:PAS domain-containing sensor histidine kinase n=1 Tax=Actinoplanes sp. NPDC026619 TaxID=3155798 RepID=UPI0033EEBD19